MLRKMNRMGLALAAALVMTSAPRADEASDQRDKLKGTWISKGPADGADESQWVFDGDHLKVTSPKRNYGAKFLVDCRDKPHRIDFEIDKAPEDAKGKIALGIYKLDQDDDTLTICIGGQDDYRPGDFKQEPGKSYLFTLKRKK